MSPKAEPGTSPIPISNERFRVARRASRRFAESGFVIRHKFQDAFSRQLMLNVELLPRLLQVQFLRREFPRRTALYAESSPGSGIPSLARIRPDNARAAISRTTSLASLYCPSTKVMGQVLGKRGRGMAPFECPCRWGSMGPGKKGGHAKAGSKGRRDFQPRGSQAKGLADSARASTLH